MKLYIYNINNKNEYIASEEVEITNEAEIVPPYTAVPVPAAIAGKCWCFDDMDNAWTHTVDDHRGKTIYNSFVTVEFMGLDSLPLKSSDNPPGRLDILDHTVEKNISIFKRKEVEELRMLLKQLHVCEERRIDSLLLNRLSPEERKVWEQIYSIDENEEFEEEIKDFLDEKKKKYLRFLQEDFYRNSVRSIEIINEYIDRKQSYIPIRKKVGTFFMRHLYRLIGVILACILGVVLVVLSVTGQENETIWIVYSALSSCIIYIFFPIVHEIFFKEK